MYDIHIYMISSYHVWSLHVFSSVYYHIIVYYVFLQKTPKWTASKLYTALWTKFWGHVIIHITSKLKVPQNWKEEGLKWKEDDLKTNDFKKEFDLKMKRTQKYKMPS